MSKLGKKPIQIGEGVTVTMEGNVLSMVGKAGTVKVPVLPNIVVKIADGAVTVESKGTDVQSRANWGTQASLIKNAIAGAREGFMKTLEIEGVGFRATMEGTTLVLSVGFTNPVRYTPRPDVKIVVEKSIIKVSGVDKAVVGQVAAEIRKIKKPEPYKGKGIHYLGEVIRRKAGKKVAGAGDAK